MHNFIDRPSHETINIREVISRKVGKKFEVSACVAGIKIWFLSEDVTLRPDALAFLISLYFTSRQTGKKLFCEQKVKETRRKSLPKVDALSTEWWGLEQQTFLEFGKSPDIGEGSGTRVGAFLSSGIHSFNTLLERESEIDDLILVHGFDIPLSDTARFKALRDHSEAVATQTGKRLIVLETNLREHPIFEHITWTQNHGAAMAAVGHLLSDEVDTLLIPATSPCDELKPSGSHPLLDHLWSSGHLKIEHTGDDTSRYAKINRHGNNPVLQNHLIVCPYDNGLSLNCGVCEKCILTQLEFLCCDHHIPNTFPADIDFAVALRSISKIETDSDTYHLALINQNISDEIKREIRALLLRSGLELENHNTTDEPLWNKSVVTSRIQDTKQRVRYQAGSPNQKEIAAYTNYLPSEKICAKSTAIVLGMTPELRQMAVQRFNKVIAFDTGEAAIHAYRDWVPDELKQKEKIYSVDWRHLGYFDWSLYPPVCAVLGDGIFGNMPDISAQRSLLQSLSNLFPHSVFIFRKALAEFAYKSDQEALQSLRDTYRAGAISDDAFGLDFLILKKWMRYSAFASTGSTASLRKLSGKAFYKA